MKSARSEAVAAADPRAFLELDGVCEAVRRDDAEAKQALFKEAVYLGIQPELFTGEG